MLAVPTVKGTKTSLHPNGLFQIVADTPPEGGGKLIAIFNSSAELQYNVVFDFTEPVLVALGETKVEGNKYALVLYPGETKEFVSGKYKAVKKQIAFGAPDKSWIEKRSQEIDKQVERETQIVKELLQRFPRADRKYSAEYVAGLCEQNSVPFVDVTFLPRGLSLSRDVEGKPPSYVWMRPSSYCTQPSSLFVDAIEPNDIDQGTLGDCYLLCAIACCSEMPLLVKDIFSPPQNSRLGIYRARICKNGWWQVCTVDDLLPIHPVTKLPAYAKNRSEPNELWVSMIEKVYAKLFGSYAAIRAGDPAHALADLLGCPYERFSQNQLWLTDKDKFFDYLVQCNAGGSLMSLGTPGSETATAAGAAPTPASTATAEEKATLAQKYKEVGLLTNHSFSLLKARHVHGKRLCQIRNPWGNELEWNGDWSDHSPLWTPQMMEAVQFTRQDDGTFWMCWEDVVKWFDSGCVAHVMPTWTQLRLAGNFEGGVPDIIVKLEISAPTTLWFGCHQRDNRGLVAGDRDHKYCGVQVAILQDKEEDLPGAKKTTAKSVICGSSGTGNYQSSRETFGRAELAPSSKPYYIVVQAFQEVSKSFALSLFIENPSTIKRGCFLSYADGAAEKKRYNPATSFHSSYAPIAVAGQYQLLLPSYKLPIEQTSEFINFHPPVPSFTAPAAPEVDKAKAAKLTQQVMEAGKRMKLTVTVVSGKDLVAKDIGGTSDPYVTIGLFDEKGKRYPDTPEVSTRYIKNTLNPVWGEKFTFSVIPSDILYIECWDKDVFGRDAMGNMRFSVESLKLTGEAKRESKPLKGGDATGEIEFIFATS